MRIGITGAHRVGKSTLARSLSRVLHLPFLTSVASQVAAEHGFNMATDNRLDTGMAMQDEQASRMSAQLREHQSIGFVSDRTPLDAAAYLLADATAYAGTEASRADTVLYVEDAIRVTAELFDVIILVPPAIAFEPLPGKPPMNTAYQEHHHMLVRGMLFDEALGHMQHRVGTILRENTDRADRLAAALDFIGGAKASSSFALAA